MVLQLSKKDILPFRGIAFTHLVGLIIRFQKYKQPCARLRQYTSQHSSFLIPGRVVPHNGNCKTFKIFSSEVALRVNRIPRWWGYFLTRSGSTSCCQKSEESVSRKLNKGSRVPNKHTKLELHRKLVGYN